MRVEARIAAPIAAVLLLVGCGGSGSSGAGPGAGSAQTGTATTVDDDAPFACPAPSDRTPVSGSDTLPTGARAALLCARDTDAPWVAPHGALHQGLDQLVGVVNAQRVHDPRTDDNCADVGGPGWTIVLRYADGTRTIQGDNGGCWDLTVGSTERFGARRVYEAFNRALLHQRTTGSAPDAVFPPPSCPSRPDFGSFSPLADATHATSVTVCVRVGSRYRPVRLRKADLRLLQHEFATSATRRTHLDGASGCHALPPRSGVMLVGADPWGDPFTVLTTCDTYRILQPPDSRTLFARMLPATAHLIGRLTQR
jgi:hypothetical protein